MIALIFIFILFNIFLAKYDAKRILANKSIDHALNAAIYLFLLIGAFVAGDMIFHFNWLEKVSMVISLLLTRKVVFDISLSLFRGLKWDYTSNTTGSVIDKLESKIFKSGTVKYLFYGALLLANTILNILL